MWITESLRPSTIVPTNDTSALPSPQEAAFASRFVRESEELERAFAARLHRWDRHVTSCSSCLVWGNELCDDGQGIADQVARAREAVESHAIHYLVRPEAALDRPNVFRRAWQAWASLLDANRVI